MKFSLCFFILIASMCATTSLAGFRSVQPETKEIQVSPLCISCKMTFAIMQQYAVNSTDFIEDYIHEKCLELLIPVSQSVCPIVDAQIKSLLSNVDNPKIPQYICSKIGMCPIQTNGDGCHTEVVCSCCPSQCSVKLVC